MPTTGNILRNERMLFLSKVIADSNLENTYNYTMRTNFDHHSPKITLRIYLLLAVLLKLSGYYVLGAIQKLHAGLFFDLGIRTEIIRFYKSWIWKNRKKAILRISKSNKFGLEA